MIMRFFLFVWVLFLTSPFSICAHVLEGIYFSHLGLADGLSHSSVFAIDQDKEGKLWFATYDGVNRYDGYKFTVYRHQYKDPYSLANDIARCLVVDSVDRVWVGTREGLSLYDRCKDAFSNYFYKKGGKDISVVGICSISQDLLMLVTGEDVLFFDVKKTAFVESLLFQSVRLSVPSTLKRQGDNVYIGTEDGVYIYSIAKNTLNKFAEIPHGVRVQSILCQSDRVWMGTEGSGLYVYEAKTHRLKHYRQGTEKQSGLNSDYVRSLGVDDKGQLWVGTYGGLNIYQQDTDSFLSIESSEMQDGSLSQNSVRSIFRDSQGGMWLGTYWGGVNYYHPLCNQFRCLRHIPFINSLSDNIVSCIVEDKNQNLWIGTSNGGLNFYNRVSRQFKSYPFKAGEKDLNMPFRDIKTVYVDEANDEVYVGAHAGGMMVLHRKSGKMEYYNRSNSNIISNNIYSILPDDNDGLLLASLDGLLRYDRRNRRFAVIETDRYGEKIPQSNTVLFLDSKRRLWLGGKKGIAVCNMADGMLVVDKEYNNWIPSLTDAFVNCFHESVTGYMWIGTRNGLFVLRNGGDDCRQYTVADGLPSNVIYGILEDSNGNLWISTNQGLSCLNQKNGRFRNFTVFDGLQSNQFNAGSYCRLKNGKMLFGGINGITVFHPETLIDNPYTPKPSIDKFFVFNKEVLPGDETGILKKSIETVDHVTLASSQNSFAISFVVSNFVSGRHNTFMYKLDGYDRTWYKQGDITPVSYSNLPAGEYTFYVKVANNDGRWNEEPAVLHIRILPVWYCSWWFVLILLVVVVLLVCGVVRYFRLRNSMQTALAKERLDKERQEEMNEMKISFYVNISHELRTPLTLIVAPLQELLKRIKGHWEHEQLLYINRNTTRLLHLVNQMMDYRRAELGIFELHPMYGNAYKKVMNCFVNYESLAKRKDIDYNFCTELQEENGLFDENYLDLITNNLLSNAFKYTEVGESIMVRLYKENMNLVLQVADTGVGIPKEKQKKVFERFYQVESGCEGSGIGLSLVQRLVELHHGKITLQSEVGKGSVFTVYLPQNESAYTQEELSCGRNELDGQRVYSTNARDIYVGEEENMDIEDPELKEETKRGTVLVAEDNEELRRYIVQGLSEQFNVLEAENGQKALEVLKNTEVDLIVTDVMMPIMDGIKLCKSVKQNLRTCHIPVYMLSAKSDVKYQLKGLQVGADDYIPKPFSIEVLKAKILNALRMRYRIFERYSNTVEIEPEKITGNSMDEDFLRKAIAVVEKNMDNVEFSTEQFAREMNMSRSGLHLKLKSITGKSAIDFIHKIRFNRACQLLREGEHTVAEISFMVGYNTPSYFATRFKKYMGCLPTEYGKKKTE